MRDEFSEAFKVRIAVSVFFVLTVIAQLVFVVALIGEIDIFNRLDRGEFISFIELTDSDDFVATAGGFVLLLAAVSFVLLLVWTYRTHQNLPELRAEDPRFSPGWTIGGWLIPVVNLLMPFFIFQEMWKASSTERPSWRQSPGDRLIVVWWSIGMSSLIGAIIAFLLRDNAIDDLSYSAVVGSDWALIAMFLLNVGFALLTIAVLWRLAGRQTRTYDEFVAAGVYRESSETPTPQAPAAPADPAPRARDAASREIRLAELARLADSGLISDEEAAERRRRILDDL